MKLTKYTLTTIFITLTVVLLSLAIKGEKGDPIYHQSQETRDTKLGGPFESSGSTSRYALTEAIVEDSTFFLNKSQAAFASPDVSEYQEKYFSLFTPGVSFLGIPFYIIGKALGIPQLITFLSTSLLALLNLLLIAKLARKLGAGFYTSLLSGIIFLFASNALSYALTFTQHHAATAIILLALLNLFGERTTLKNVWLGILFGAGLLVDIPNGILMAPILLYVLYKHLNNAKIKDKMKITLKLNVLWLILGLLPLLTIFGWYNREITGSYSKIGQTAGRSRDFATQVDKEISKKKTEEPEPQKFSFPFRTRNQLNGLYTLLISNERGVIFYSPVVLVGLLGLVSLYKTREKKSAAVVLTSLILINLLTYSMFGDPWGGWAFGPRYLIPAAAILCSTIGIVLNRFRKNILFILVFLLLTIYSLAINVLGAMTTTQVPPKVEAVNLSNPIPYTYEYNWQLMQKGESSSLVYNLWLSDKITAQVYAVGYLTLAFAVVAVLYIASLFEKKAVKRI